MIDGLNLCECDKDKLSRKFVYHKRPDAETDFGIPEEDYERSYLVCNVCGHWFGDHTLNLDQFYEGEYVEKTYGSKMVDTFNRIINLPPEKSDNVGRVQRIEAYKNNYFGSKEISLLDVGSGLGVFPYAIDQLGWDVTALDPDPNAAKHMRENLDLKCIEGDFFNQSDLGRFDIITFNKVLEHVLDPVAMLSKAKSYLNQGGLVYIELPDGEVASKYGQDREEFYIEHHHVFSLASTITMARQAGFTTLSAQRLQEPSTKYTLFCFLSAE